MNDLVKWDEIERQIDDLLIEEESIIKQTGVQGAWIIGEQLSIAKQKIIEMSGDGRAPGFVEWMNRKFGWNKSTSWRLMDAYHNHEEDIKKIWGHDKKVALAQPILPIPEGKYNIIYADPPWPIDSMILEKWESPIDDKYPTMTIEQIKTMEIEKLTGDNCSLFLWTTHTYLQEAFEVIKVWGFKYHVCITWDKGSGWSVCGFHRRTEFCLYAYKGKMNISQTGKYIPTLITEPKREHSRKPEIMYEYIERSIPEPRIELFARKKRRDWEAWGNEIIEY